MNSDSLLFSRMTEPTKAKSASSGPSVPHEELQVAGWQALRTLIVAICAGFTCTTGTALGQAPANDNFANSQIISGSNGSASGTNVSATLEPGEPTTTDGSNCANSVWFRWTAPVTGSYTFGITSLFRSQLAIYTGNGPGSLTSKVENAVGGYESQTVVLAATAGIVYQVRITGYEFISPTGSFTLNWLPVPPPNDNLANAQVFNFYNGAISLAASNFGATVESGEVSFAGLPAPTKSVWYQLFISADTTVTVSTAGSDFDTVVSVYRRDGPAVAGLAPIAGNDDLPPLRTSQVTFNASHSVGTYYIAVAGSNGAQGSVSLSLTSSVAQPYPINGQRYERMVSFPDLRVAGLPNRGAAPESRLTAASNGFLYGTTTLGGEHNLGTVFRMTVGGALTTLVEFTGETGARKGAEPAGSLIEATDGNFYGTTRAGGTHNFGTIFRMTPSGNFVTLFEFTGTVGAVKGARPVSAMVQAADGTLYGTTGGGGQYGHGTVFRILHDGTFQTVVEFSGSGGPFSGSRPNALVAANDGNVYGTFYERDPGSIFGAGGGIFRITPGGSYSEVHSFQDIGGGYSPVGLVQGPGGALYGVTAGSPARDIYENDYPPTVFKYTPGGNLETLMTFGLYTGVDGGLYFDDSGNLFGFTQEFFWSSDTIFRIPASGAFETIVDFSTVGRDGWMPVGGLVRGIDGNVFGMTRSGGFQDAGTVFRLSSANVITTVLEFSMRGYIDNGQGVLAGLVEHPDGYFYGTAGSGGTKDNGVVFKMAGDGTLTKLVDFTGTAGLIPGRRPAAELLVGSDGVLYGTTGYGGAQGSGTLFKVTNEGSFEKLRDFSDHPDVPLMEGQNGMIYGVSGYDSAFFRIGKNGQAFESLASLQWRGGSLVQDSQGDIYGCCRYGGVDGRGYVYRMVAATGQVQILNEFGQIAGGAAGYHPMAGLTRAGDGSYYGTTSEGGAFGFGTVFRMSPNGAVDAVVSFMGPDGPRRGANPVAGVKAGADGWYYGVTSAGGIGNQGTLYRFRTSGEFETLLDFAYYLVDGPPVGELFFGSDGNVYGARSDALFRMVLPGPPMIYASSASTSLTGVVDLQGKVNPRGSACTVVVEYGTDGVVFPSVVTLRTGLTGVKTTRVGTTIGPLAAGTQYFYRIRATNANGATIGPVNSFATVGVPVTRLSPATDIGRTSARLKGTVDARFSDAAVFFEYGTDGSTFPKSVQAVPGTVAASSDVEALVDDLEQGVTYFYRLVATNAAGKGVSGTGVFSTLIEPLALVSGAEAISTTRARVNGTVDARGAYAAVAFEWGTDGVSFLSSVAASPALVSGNGPVAVTAVLTGLNQGLTYHYRIRTTGPGGTGPGGVDFSETGTFRLSILSGLAQVFPDPPQPGNGTVTVNFDPPTRGGWRFVGEQAWRGSGVPAGFLTSGMQVIEFLPVPGYIVPPREALDVVNGEDLVLDRFYYETQVAGSGSLVVRLKPEEIASADVPLATRAQWRFVGDAEWRDSEGPPLTGLAAGTYLVECKPVVGRVTPPTASVSIEDNIIRDLSLTYFTANDTGGAVPAPLPFSSVSADEDLPFAYTGQIRSEVGSSTGFVVKRRVVATAGHVVFDDGTLSAVAGLQWLFQRHAGQHEPHPQVPRGFYLAAGYADQRIADATPGEGSPESQHLDYAALYFLEEAGRGGYGGYLASDAGDDNEFLTSSDEKILAGYAVDGVPSESVGRLHATAAFSSALIPAFGETWTTSAVRGLGGCSGGPLFVRHSNGIFLPAAIYLGGASQTVVRAIDSQVVDLFNRAEVSGNGGDNNTGGGITHSSVSAIGGTSDAGVLKVTLLPAGAREVGAGWKLKPESFYRLSGAQKSGLSPGTYLLQLKTVDGFEVPEPQAVVVRAGQLKEITFTYAPANTVPSIGAVANRTINEDESTGPITFSVGDGETSAGSLVVTRASSNTTLVPLANIVLGGSGAFRSVTVTPAANQSGTAMVTLTVSDGELSATEIFTVTVNPVNDPPVVSAPADQTFALNTVPGALAVGVADLETAAASLSLTVSSSNGSLIPSSAMTLGGSGAARTLVIVPSPGQLGSAFITLAVSDGSLSTSAVFEVEVTGTALETWRFGKFGRADNSGTAADTHDADGDGQTNREEYAADTDPNDPADSFRVISSRRVGGMFRAVVPGRAGRSYALERGISPAGPAWARVATTGLLATSGDLELTDPVIAGNKAFYRVVVELP